MGNPTGSSASTAAVAVAVGGDEGDGVAVLVGRAVADTTGVVPAGRVGNGVGVAAGAELRPPQAANAAAGSQLSSTRRETRRRMGSPVSETGLGALARRSIR